MYVTIKQFFNLPFVLILVLPMTVCIVMQIAAGNWFNVAWQTVVFALCCINNYLMLANKNIKECYLQEIELNIELLNLTNNLLEKNTKEKEEIKK